MALPDFFFERVTTDIRQQMDGVLALAEQLRRTRLTADAESCVASVAEAAEGVSRLLEAAVSLRDVNSQGLIAEPAPLALRELMDTIEARWALRAANAGVRLLVSYDGDPEAAVMADRTRLIQVFDGFIAEAVGRAAASSRRAFTPTPPTKPASSSPAASAALAKPIGTASTSRAASRASTSAWAWRSPSPRCCRATC